jgi:hypothetical protein
VSAIRRSTGEFIKEPRSVVEKLADANTKTLDSMLEGATDVGNPLGYPRTPGEFAARWNGFTEERRQEFLDALIRESSIAALHKQMCRLTTLSD